MTLRVEVLRGARIAAHLDAIAALRLRVFREWPYLYDGDLAYEKEYLSAYQSPGAVVVGAFDGDRMVGAATAARLEDHAADFAAAFEDRNLCDFFYLAESVLLSDYRGKGIGHRFFDLREQAARQEGRTSAVFCSVLRPEDHPRRPLNARTHDAFWRGRGYAPLEGVVARFAWRDLGEGKETRKPLQFWGKTL